MKIKTFITTLFVCLFTCTAVFATTKQDRKVDAFSKINIGSAFKVYLMQGSIQSVAVEIDEEYINDVETKVSNGTLYVKLESNNYSGNRNIHVMNVYITIPTIDGITASGAAKFQVETPIKNNGTVKLNLSGASSVKDISLTCKELKIDQSGASKCSINLTADIVDTDISGAAKLELSGKVDKLIVDASGASKADVRSLKYNTSDVDTSAAASVRR